ncbi:anti-anti-sigma factor [Nocardioides aromaticivorans]|uniref:Anti-sigma factor antagonist n=1 Tax=Nocardioides aromaticivorans TaxID=200618 RepID=A0A7Z0CK74_9ACTN|nr:STAS domain-containing protein [Nocardioides aromaticivorans]NYI44446.1 anti-anti-sigma factor [Nocardioides aromaticivorans]
MTQLTASALGPTWQIQVSGEIDIAASDDLLGLALTGLDQHEHLRLDLAGVTFMDSGGLGILLQIRRHAIDTGKLLTLRSLGPGTRRLLEVVGLKQLFEVEEDPAP